MESNQKKGKRPNFAHMKNKKKKGFNRDDVRLSKKLSYILRHGAIDLKIEMGDDGFVFLDELIKKGKVKASLAKIQKVVNNNDKKRFEMVKDFNEKWKIRAVQGHTLKHVDQEKLLTKITDPNYFKDFTVVHGTYMPAWKEIMFGGLNRMSRNHMHFAKGYNFQDESSEKQGDVISGMRNTCDIFIEIDPVLAMASGIDIYESKNGVILTEGYNGNLPTCFFRNVYVRGDCVEKYKKEIGTTLFDLNLNKKGDPYKNGPILDESVLNKGKNLKEQRVLVMRNQMSQPFINFFSRKYLFVLDFEANCVNNGKLNPQEIVEFPIVPIEVAKAEVVPEMIFHTYIKPQHHEITPFCTELTGITSEMVSKGVSLEKALEMFDEHLEKFKLAEEDFVFVTCGNWDLNTCLKKEANFKKITLRSCFRRFINIKDVFRLCKKGPKKIGMQGMLKFCNIELEGRHHSGIDDSKNIAKIMCDILKQGALINRAYEKST
jgi:RNA:NAD 2'-phosphotransferase (TPT1/KptA family)/inhibitor of KinA sporulation pathway (predicted exonuclease)